MDIKRAEIIAKDCMIYHGLENWVFEFSYTKNCFGQCNYAEKKIILSKYLTELNEENEVLDCILHEIAHAISPKFSHHNKTWKQNALSIGCNGQRCYDINKVKRPEAKHVYTCQNCGYKFLRYRKLKSLWSRYHIPCGKIQGKLLKIK